MFTIEHEFDASVITLVDEGSAPLREDVTVQAFDSEITFEQWDPRTDRISKITLSPEQLRDLTAALNLPEGIYRSTPKPQEDSMATGTNIKTYFNGQWHDGDRMIMNAADHGAWLGTTVFDGARLFDGMSPDLDKHCARVNRSAAALMITPTVEPDTMVALIREGLESYGRDQSVYIRPMYWALEGDDLGVVPRAGATGFAISLEEIPMAPPEAATTLTRTRFRRPVLEDNVVNAKAGCLYPNNARMLNEARSKGFGNALVADAMGNVAETATANIFMVRDGEVFTPIPNGTFLAGITRARHISNLRADGLKVHETVLSFEDFHAADEVFLSGNMMKVTPVSAFDDTTYEIGPNANPVTRRARALYWDWAASQAQADRHDPIRHATVCDCPVLSQGS